ncbi:MAG: tryptophan--tRNA ligase [Candidatus Gracilibacteria bacterium]|nr:tryptophan--tRNA ligase [Candidatus Gracilibacteria bacterium]
MKKIITGVKSTGSTMHLGNLMGAVLPFQKAAIGNDAAIFIADLHSLTSVKNGKTLEEQTLEVAIEYLAIYGVDTPITIFRQSDIHAITKLMWILTNVTPYSLMLRAHSFKDAEAKNSDINMGVFNYPILMAADIIGYQIDAVPVGQDQRQHLEMTRDIVRNFNKIYALEWQNNIEEKDGFRNPGREFFSNELGKDFFKEPEAIIDEKVATLPGIDGRKMSKSYDNFIGIFDDEKLLKKRVMSIVTDSKGVDDIKDADTCTIVKLLEVFGKPLQIDMVKERYQTPNAGFGYGHAKLILLEALAEYLRPYRERRTNLLGNLEFVEQKLEAGAKIMNARLDATMEQITKLVGIH